MHEVFEILEHIVALLANAGVILFEIAGTIIIIWSGALAFVKMIRKDHDAPVALVKGLAHGLSFLTGGEILKTLVTSDFRQLGLVAGILALRAALSFLLQIEEKAAEREARELDEEDERKAARKDGGTC